MNPAVLVYLLIRSIIWLFIVLVHRSVLFSFLDGVPLSFFPPGLTPKSGQELAIRSLGALVWYLQKCVIDHELLSMKLFQIYEPRDALEGAEDGGKEKKKKDNEDDDVSTGPLARPFARSLAPLTHSLASPCLLRSRAPLRSFVRSLAHSRARGKVNDSMSQNDLDLSHSARL